MVHLLTDRAGTLFSELRRLNLSMHSVALVQSPDFTILSSKSVQSNAQAISLPGVVLALLSCVHTFV